MGERTPQFEAVKQELDKINREIIELEEMISKKTEAVKKMEREHRASVRQDTDDMVIIEQIRVEDNLKEPIAEMLQHLQMLQEERDRITGILFKKQ